MKKLLAIALTLSLAPLVAYASMLFAAGSSQDFQTNLTYSGSNFQFEFWFRDNNTAIVDGLILLGASPTDTSNRGYQFYVNGSAVPSSDLQTSACTGGTFTSQTGTAITQGNWYYARAYWDGANTTFKIWNSDGSVQSNTGTAAASAICSTSAKVIFGVVPISSYLTGNLRNVWYSTTVNTDDRATLARMNASNPVSQAPGSNILGFWSLIFFNDIRNLVYPANLATASGTMVTGIDPPNIPYLY